MKITKNKLKQIIAEEITSVLSERILRKGMAGKDVKRAQKMLIDAGYLKPGEADGKFGKITKGAVEDFQKKNNLSVDGEIGPNTMKVLKGFPVAKKTGKDPGLKSLAKKMAADTEPESTTTQAARAPRVADVIGSDGYDKSPETIKRAIEVLKDMVKTGQLSYAEAVKMAKKYRKEGVAKYDDVGTGMVGRPDVD